jgi:hypothetical protein
MFVRAANRCCIRLRVSIIRNRVPSVRSVSAQARSTEKEEESGQQIFQFPQPGNVLHIPDFLLPNPYHDFPINSPRNVVVVVVFSMYPKAKSRKKTSSPFPFPLTLSLLRKKQAHIPGYQKRKKIS